LLFLRERSMRILTMASIVHLDHKSAERQN